MIWWIPSRLHHDIRSRLTNRRCQNLCFDLSPEACGAPGCNVVPLMVVDTLHMPQGVLTGVTAVGQWAWYSRFSVSRSLPSPSPQRISTYVPRITNAYSKFFWVGHWRFWSDTRFRSILVYFCRRIKIYERALPAKKPGGGKKTDSYRFPELRLAVYSGILEQIETASFTTFSIFVTVCAFY